ncbi:TOMM precursor leader peptide-binding protein [Catellatospora coxensis]|uniref:YcaO domain-containing protein n=1 Tax=Catellatospora coxensis TaxID=310354 RepID=A0A8J3P5V5_9ACTN|nr:TOMM precursor leader peptide-binding protein [Catellatospora coxensis]GIG05101.1 hypothetical protein Cco03nite_18010 [Catellatospora coxensis]
MTAEVLNAPPTPASPMEHSRIRVADHLAGLPLRSADGRPVSTYTATLGETDLMGAAPDLGGLTGPVLPVYVYQRAVVVGPLNELPAPAQPCLVCLARRWQSLRSEEERDVLEHGGRMQGVAPSPFLTDLALRAVGDLAGWLAQADPGSVRDDNGYPFVYEIRLDTLQVTRHPLVAEPGCPLCGDDVVDSAEAAVIELQSRPKAHPDDFRLRSVHDYGLSVEAFANPVCGMLGTAAMPAYDSTTTAPVTGYTRVRGMWSLNEFFWSGHADTYDDSALLGVLEGLERYAGLSPRGKGEPLLSSLRELGDTPALDPRDCGVYIDEYYQNTSPHYHQFTDDLKVPWVWGYSLRDKRSILVPERLVYYMGRHPGTNFVQECSNGCATGSCLEEAIFYGMLELIERDAFLLAWYGKARLPEIDPGSCRSVGTRQMIDRMRLVGYDVRLFDTRIDLQMPVVTGVAVRRDGGLGRLCFAAGSSPDPEDAVRAALCEIASYVPNFDHRVEDALEDTRASVTDYRKITELKHHALLFGLPEMAHHADFLLADPQPKPIGEIYAGWERDRPRNADLRDDVRYGVDLLAAAGHDVIVVDQTSPEQRQLGLRTACVIVPGLIPIDFGWQRQRVLHMPRLRTAFRRAGWRDTDLAISEINFVPHPFP